jgi:hypothetical protein
MERETSKVLCLLASCIRIVPAVADGHRDTLPYVDPFPPYVQVQPMVRCVDVSRQLFLNFMPGFIERSCLAEPEGTGFRRPPGHWLGLLGSNSTEFSAQIIIADYSRIESKASPVQVRSMPARLPHARVTRPLSSSGPTKV